MSSLYQPAAPLPDNPPTPAPAPNYTRTLLGQGTSGSCYLFTDPENPENQWVVKYAGLFAGMTKSQALFLLEGLKKEAQFLEILYRRSSSVHDWIQDIDWTGPLTIGKSYAALSMVYLGKYNITQFIQRKKHNPFAFSLTQFLFGFGHLMTNLSQIHLIHKILHLDIKPENIIVSDKKNRGYQSFRFADFGNALKLLTAHLDTYKRTTISTRDPLSGIFKEQSHSAKADIFGLAMSILISLGFDIFDYLKRMYGEDYSARKAHPEDKGKYKKSRTYDHTDPVTGAVTTSLTVRHALRSTYGKNYDLEKISKYPDIFRANIEIIRDLFSDFLNRKIPEYLMTLGIFAPKISESLINILMFMLNINRQDRMNDDELKLAGEYFIALSTAIADAKDFADYPACPFTFTLESSPAAAVAPAPEADAGCGAGSAVAAGDDDDDDVKGVRTRQDARAKRLKHAKNTEEAESSSRPRAPKGSNPFFASAAKSPTEDPVTTSRQDAAASLISMSGGESVLV